MSRPDARFRRCRRRSAGRGSGTAATIPLRACCRRRLDRARDQAASEGRRCRRSRASGQKNLHLLSSLIAKDQVDRRRRHLGLLEPGRADASASAGEVGPDRTRMLRHPAFSPGQHVADQVADHPRCPQIQLEIGGRAEQHPGSRLPVRVFRRSSDRRRQGRLGNSRSRRSTAPPAASCRFISAWIWSRPSSVSIPRPMADWLVTSTRANPARRSRLRASAAPGRSRTSAGSVR